MGGLSRAGHINSYRGLNASGFTVEGLWVHRVWAGDKFMSLLHHLQKCFLNCC